MFCNFSCFPRPGYQPLTLGLNLGRQSINSNHYFSSVFFFSGGDMGKGFYISKALGIVCVVAAIGAVATIIALSVVYAQEKSKNEEALLPSTSDPGATTLPPTTPSAPKEPWDHYRLPDTLAPLTYNVTLWPRLEPNKHDLYIFTGHSKVVFRCVKETDLILIHSNKLNLTALDGGHHATLTGLDGATAPGLKKTWLEIPTEYLVIQLDSPLQAGSKYELFTDFVGELADDLGGFYRSEYIEDGVKKYESPIFLFNLISFVFNISLRIQTKHETWKLYMHWKPFIWTRPSLLRHS